MKLLAAFLFTSMAFGQTLNSPPTNLPLPEKPCTFTADYCRRLDDEDKVKAYGELLVAGLPRSNESELAVLRVHEGLWREADWLVKNPESTNAECDAIAASLDIEKLRAWLKSHKLLPPPPPTHEEQVKKLLKDAKAAAKARDEPAGPPPGD